MSATLNRYALPVPPDADGESVHLCDLCVDDHPQATELEHLERSNRNLDECEGPDGEGCPHVEDDDDYEEED